MPYATELTVIHHDDTRTRYQQEVRYDLSRAGVRVWTADGERAHTDFLMVQADHQRTGSDR